MWFCIMSGIYVRELGPDCGATLCMYVSISRDVWCQTGMDILIESVCSDVDVE